MNQTVIGVFDTNNHANSAREALVDAGFTKSNIDFSTYGEKGYAHDEYNDNHSNSVTGFFRDLFDTDDHTATTYADVASRGTVVTVHTTTMDEAKRAAAILDSYGAIDFDNRAAAYKQVDVNSGKLAGDTIKVINENIAVGKRDVVTGGVEVRSRIIEKPVTETLRLRQEEVFVKRTPVDRVATEADMAAGTGTISVTETAEEAVVAKEARVVEEIEVGKNVTERSETINDTVRETEVDVVEKTGEIVREHDKSRKLS